MNATHDRLTALTAADVMTRDIVLLSTWQSMSQAAAAFAEHGISGAPVIDGMGRCVGVLSAFDFVRRQKWQADHGRCCGTPCSGGKTTAEKHAADEAAPGDLVGAWMTPRVKAVSPETPLVDAARQMCSLRIHRLLVVDQYNVPVGLISSVDLVEQLVNAVDAQVRMEGPMETWTQERQTD